MNSLPWETIALEKHKESLWEIVKDLVQLVNKYEFISVDITLQLLIDNGYKARILKTPNPLYPSDSFIIGVNVGEKTIAIKIHWSLGFCEEIYLNKEILNDLIKDQNIPEVLCTWSTKYHRRIIIYLWKTGDRPDVLMQNSHDQAPLIKKALTKLIRSISRKQCEIFDCPPENFLVSPGSLKCILLDVNHLIHYAHRDEGFRPDIAWKVKKMLEFWKRETLKNLEVRK